MPRRAIIAVPVALAVLAAVLLAFPLAASATSTSTVVEGFEPGGVVWKPSTNLTLSSSSTHTEGTTAASLAYDVSKGDAAIIPATTAVPLVSKAYSAFTVDIKGDGSWNTVYFGLTDAAGEVFTYRVDAVGYTTWKTVTVDLTKTPNSVAGPNSNSVLDAPFSLTRISIVRNGTQPATGTILLDNVRTVNDGWGVPTAVNSGGAKNFVPSAAQTSTVAFTAGGAGDYRLLLMDPAANIRTFTGRTTGAGPVSAVFDGKADSGVVMSGVIRGELSYDTTADGTLAAKPVNVESPYLTGIAARVEAAAPASIVGVNGDVSTAGSVAQADSKAKLMEDAYVHYDREQFEWKRVEPTKGTFDWWKFDQTVAVDNARNVQILGRLVFSATWASSAPAGTPAADVDYYPPTNMSDYVNYAKAVVHRYKGSVKVWEVWNEPDSAAYWKPAPSAAAYSAMLTATYSAIKAEDPTATVLTGGLVGFDSAFLEGMRTAGAMNSFDGLGLHTFVTGAPESSQDTTWLDGAEAFLARYGPGKKVWITEMGWSTCSACSTQVTEAQQAQYLSRAYLDAANRGIAEISWWNLIEFGTSTNSIDNYGLVEQGGAEEARVYRSAEARRRS